MKSVINIAICEDDEKQVMINKKYIEQWGELRELPLNILVYPSAESFLFNWNYEQHIDIIFLDIVMGRMSGIELAKHIRSQDEEVTIIFITGEESYVFDGYKVQALDYLMKPVKKEDIFYCLDRWKIKSLKEETSYYLVKKGKELVKINYDDIYYFISFDHYIDINTVDEVITFKEKIGQVEQDLPGTQFCRCHRSYIVNLKHIESIYKNEVILDNGSKLPVSKSRLNTTYESFMSYFRKRIKPEV